MRRRRKSSSSAVGTSGRRRTFSNTPAGSVSIAWVVSANSSASFRASFSPFALQVRRVASAVVGRPIELAAIQQELSAVDEGRLAALTVEARVVHCRAHAAGRWFVGCRFTRQLSAMIVRSLLDGYIAIPHAIEVEGAIIRLFDPVNHEVLPSTVSDDEGLDLAARHDRRWVRCRRPMVMVGGSAEHVGQVRR